MLVLFDASGNTQVTIAKFIHSVDVSERKSLSYIILITTSPAGDFFIVKFFYIFVISSNV